MSESLKRRAAEAALAFVEDGMRLGLGSGSTAAHFVRLLGERVADGLRRRRRADLRAGPSALAREAGVPLTTLDETPELDLDVDGADEIGPALALIKGGGGALLREKIVANASRRMIVIADAGKRVAELGAFPLPIEVVAFGLTATASRHRAGGQRARPDAAPSTLRTSGRRALRDRWRQPHARRIFWPHSRPRSPGGPARRHPRRRRARSLPRASPTSPSSLRPTGSRRSRRDNHSTWNATASRRPTEVDMKASLAALLVAVAAILGAAPAYAQDAPRRGQSALQNIIETELPPETHGACDEARAS